MIVEFRKKSQITIPKELVANLGLQAGDKLEIIEKDGVITMKPVVVYPKGCLCELKDEFSNLKTKLESGEKPLMDNVEILFRKLDSKEM